MPKNNEIKKVLVVGSGPIIIGQAAEFDYAGTQACRTLREEGIYTVLINSNPATIMTDRDIADSIYIEPLTVPTVKKVIIKERPDSILPTLGGQTGLNLCMELDECGFLEAHGVRLLGTTADIIKKAEDRQSFKDMMESIGEPCIESKVVRTLVDALEYTERIGYPVVVRPAYTLGGSGGGIAHDRKQLTEICSTGLRLSRVCEVLIEKCISGWKEIEYEVIRDSAGNCITVCNMENIDPVGVHTGDSIVVAPTQTLSKRECDLLRTSALNIISALGIEGGCNVQFALHPESFRYAVIEVNPRVSRSSALASKATGYPIAKVTAKIALGYHLDEITNAVTGSTYACSEPAIDYLVIKMPRWPFDKFVYASRTLSTQMKATGEVMSIASSFEGAMLKAIRSLELGLDCLILDKLSLLTDEEVHRGLFEVTDERIFMIAEALRRGITPKLIRDITKIDLWFIERFAGIVEMETGLRESCREGALKIGVIKKAKTMGYTDRRISLLTGIPEREIREFRLHNGIVPGYKIVDTCAGEYKASTPYYYSSYGAASEITPGDSAKKVLVLGSGPIRIGQGIEFDYCSVHCVWALRAAGYETIIVNNNPETVSTDFDIADKLFFEPLTPEDVQNIVDAEKPCGAVVQFGGQTAIKLAHALTEMGVPLLGTSADDVDAAEDRERFDAILESCGIPRPKGTTVFTTEEALEAANSLEYPVLVRPSYVLGGQGMQIAFCDDDIIEYIAIINRTVQEHPILVDKYVMGREVEVDAVCDGEGILIPGIMEHLERAGVHSGDSISVYPPQSVSYTEQQTIIEYTKKLAKALNVIGLINIQFIISDGIIYVIEVNPRSSRTVPYISKITGVPIVDLATQCLFGKTIPELGFRYGLVPVKPYVAVKLPVFSFEKLYGTEVSLGPEMKSTGEVLGLAETLPQALMKAFHGNGVNLPDSRKIIITVKDSDKEEAANIAARFAALTYIIYATENTCRYLRERGIPCIQARKIDEGEPTIIDLLLGGDIDLIINTPTNLRRHKRDGFLIRRNAVEAGVPCLTSLDTATALLTALEYADVREMTTIDVSKI